MDSNDSKNVVKERESRQDPEMGDGKVERCGDGEWRHGPMSKVPGPMSMLPDSALSATTTLRCRPPRLSVPDIGPLDIGHWTIGHWTKSPLPHLPISQSPHLSLSTSLQWRTTSRNNFPPSAVCVGYLPSKRHAAVRSVVRQCRLFLPARLQLQRRSDRLRP